MTTINIKPLSVNECWRGKRFKTHTYEKYENDLLFLLPKIKIPQPPYRVQFEFGFSSASCDVDNPCKPLMDILQKKYGFNDKSVNELLLTRKQVKKGEEFIAFKIESLAV